MKFNFVIDDKIVAKFYQRMNSFDNKVIDVIRRDIERYYKLLETEEKLLDLKEEEWMAIYDSCNGTIFDDVSIRMLYANIEDSIKYDGLDTKWNIDNSLVEKLKSMSLSALYAVADRIERYWSATLINHTLENLELKNLPDNFSDMKEFEKLKWLTEFHLHIAKKILNE